MGPLLSITGGFASGVLLRSVFVFGWPVYAFAFLLAGLTGVALFLEPRKAYALVALFFVLMGAGMLRASFFDGAAPSVFTEALRHRVSYEGVVVGDPDLRDANQRVAIRVHTGADKTTVLAVLPRATHLAVGDRVFVAGSLEAPAPFASEGGRVFRYDKYLAVRGISFLLNYAYVRVESRAPWYAPGALLARAKHSFLDGLARTLPEPYASLAGGIVIGGKSGLGNDLQDAFVRSGLVQIIVLSGYNVMVVAEWVMAALALTRLPKRWGAAAGALALLFFVGVAGLSATAVRAALMALIALYARATGRSYAASRSLLAAVFLMLLYNPLYLAFDPGFGLSVAATAGLIWLAPALESRLVFIKNAFWKNAAATTLAAQFAVLPLLLYDTGNLSLVALPANLLVMPFVPLAMGFSALAGFAGALLGAAFPMLGFVLAYPSYLLTGYLLLVARVSAGLPGASFVLPAFPFWLVCAAYAALIAASKRFSTTLQLRFAKKAST